MSTAREFIDPTKLVGQIIGNLKVIEYVKTVRTKSSNINHYYKCMCLLCGKIIDRSYRTLVYNKNTTSLKCFGCTMKERDIERERYYASDEYFYKNKYRNTAKNILSRCNRPKDCGYHNYGGRGIKCKLGRTTREVVESLKKIPGIFKDAEIDRIDNNGDYTIIHPKYGMNVWIDKFGHQCLGNLRWVTRTENTRNRGVSVTIKSLAEKPRVNSAFKEACKFRNWDMNDFDRTFMFYKRQPNGRKIAYYIYKLKEDKLNKYNDYLETE